MFARPADLARPLRPWSRVANEAGKHSPAPGSENFEKKSNDLCLLQMALAEWWPKAARALAQQVDHARPLRP